MLEVKVFLVADAVHKGRPLYEYVLQYLMEQGISGASVFSAHMGFGPRHQLNQPQRFGSAGHEAPMLLLFVDDEAKVRAVLPHVKEVVGADHVVATRAERI